MKISDIPILERPRERLINYGVSTLSNEDLLAILLNNGTKGTSVKEVAISLISSVDEISQLNDLSLLNITAIRGIGPKKAATILAALELGKRLSQKQVVINNIQITNTKVVYDYYLNILKDKKQEYFYCLYLDNQKRVISDKLLFIGTINFSVVHPREIFKEAYKLSATAIICVHNHPSGNPKPSKEDISLTNQLVEASHILGIKVLDHIIVGTNSYYSFYESDLL